jgi:hypothetical protein
MHGDIEIDVDSNINIRQSVLSIQVLEDARCSGFMEGVSEWPRWGGGGMAGCWDLAGWDSADGQ